MVENINMGCDHEKPFVNDKVRRKFDYVEYMTDRLFTMFEWKGLPDTIPCYILERLLQWNGNACVFSHNGNLYATYGGLGGELDYNYEPTLYVIANPYLNYSAELKIGSDCVRVRNDALGKGLLPLHFRYADIMVENDITLRITDIIRRMHNGIIADNDRSFESAKDFISSIEDGRLAPIFSEEFFEGIRNIDSDVLTITDLIELQQYLKASWFNELGLNSNYNMKRERIAAPEAQMTDDALLPLAEQMLEMRKRGCEEVNRMFGTEWDVDFAGAWKRENNKQMQEENATEPEQMQEEPATEPEQTQEKTEDNENVDNVANFVDNTNDVDNNTDTGDDGANKISVDVDVIIDTNSGDNNDDGDVTGGVDDAEKID